MNIFKNKFFLFGNLAFLLLVIPVVLFFIKNQTSTRGSAAPTTTLSFNPPSLSPDQCDDKQTTRLVLNPGQNIVSTVQLALKWDKTKFEIEFTPNQAAFPQVLKGPDQTSEGMTATLNIGSDVTKSIKTTTDVGTLTIKPLAPTNGQVIKLDILTAGTKVYSLSQQDGATENVFNPAGSSSLQVSVVAKSCSGGTNPTGTVPSPTTPGGTVPSPTTPGGGTVPTTPITPTVAANLPPVCQNLAASTASGSAPLSVTFTATGSDPNGTISKATFNFGDSTQQDVTSGLGTSSASAQLSHTYNSGGNFMATVVFTDNSGAVSATCSKPIVVSGAFATLPPTIPPTVAATATSAPIATDVPVTPTLAPTGDMAQTLGIIGGVLLAIVAGIFLFAL